jgi:UDP-N-acetylmuramate dehydrogenase
MDIRHNVSLAGYSTMGLGGKALHLVEVADRNEVVTALSWANDQHLPVVMIGLGSNIIWGDSGFPGLVIVNKIMHYEAYEEDETNTYLTIGAGEPWDSVVERSVAAGLTGIEALSLVPGTSGATPIQNVGAYGQEISQTLATIEAYDTKTSGFVTIPVSECGFSYRNSRFKTTDRGRFFITGITLHLTKGNPLPPFYSSVEAYLERHKITDYTPAIIRQAVIEIRNAKLPDPAVVHNVGSFFANPIVSDLEFVQISQRHGSAVPHWVIDKHSVKLSAAWLIEQAGFKGVHDEATGMATWPKQALVLVNEHAESTASLLAFKQKIVDAVKTKFNVSLVQEPEMMSP